MRAEQGAGPVTLGIDIGVIKMIITHAAAVHGLDISPEPVDLARVALKRLGLIGKGTERERWSQKFGPVVKVDRMTRETIRNDKEKDAYA